MDKALRGNRLTKKPRGAKLPDITRRPPKERDPIEALGIIASGGIEGKPHSTKEGRRAAAANLLNRAWGQKYYNKKKKGTPV